MEIYHQPIWFIVVLQKNIDIHKLLNRNLKQTRSFTLKLYLKPI